MKKSLILTYRSNILTINKKMNAARFTSCGIRNSNLFFQRITLPGIRVAGNAHPVQYTQIINGRQIAILV